MGCHLGTDLQFLQTNNILSKGSTLCGFILNSNNFNSISLANKWFGNRSLIHDCYFINPLMVGKYMERTDPYDIVYIDGLLDSLSLEYQRTVINNARRCLSKEGHLIGRIVGLDEFPPKRQIDEVDDIHMHTIDSLRDLLRPYFPKVEIYPIAWDDLFTKRPILHFTRFSITF